MSDDAREGKDSTAWMLFPFLLFGLLICGAAIYASLHTIRLELVSATSQGRVVESDDGVEIIELEIPSERSIRTRTATTSMGVSVGQTCTVLYDPENPRRALIQSSGLIWVPLMFIVGGAVTGVIGYFGTSRKL